MMSQNFQVLKHKDGTHIVKCVHDNVVVAVKESYHDAKKLAKKLNAGTGFNGPIPAYMFNGWISRPTI